MNTTHTLGLVTRISGTVLLVFLTLIVIGTLTGDSSSSDGFHFRDTNDLIGFLLFPLGTMLGLGLAYRWPLLGGLIAVGSTILLVILRPDHLQFTFLLMVTPGLLYVLFGLLSRKRVAVA